LARSTLAIQTLNQDRELAVRRADDERRQRAAAIRQDFLGRLEDLKVRALSSTADAPQNDRAPEPDDPIVLVARDKPLRRRV
jgi:hypothetical protein